MKIKKIVKNLAKLYLAAFLAVNAHIFIDANFSEPKNHPVRMQVHKYNVNVNGKNKRLTLVGEVHRYNLDEYKIGKELIQQHRFIADECNQESINSLSLGKKAFVCAYSLLTLPTRGYYYLGSGRAYPSIAEITESNGKNVIALENGTGSAYNLNTMQKFGLLLRNAINLPFSPLSYYSGKNEKPFDYNEVINKAAFRKERVDNRDENMPQSIINILKRDEVDSLLVTTGLGHTHGIIKNLKARLDLKEINQ